MNKEIILEIERFREILNLPLILESKFPWTIYDEITVWVGKSFDENLFTFISKPAADVKSTQLLDELTSVARKLNLEVQELITKMEKKTLSNLEADELGAALLRAGNKELQDIVYKAYLKISPGVQIMQNTLNAKATQDILNSGNTDSIEKLRALLEKPVQESTELGDEVKKYYLELIEKQFAGKLKIDKTPLDSLEESAKKRLGNNLVSFKDNFKLLYRSILEKRGKSWGEVLGEELTKENFKFLDFLKTNFPEKKWKFLHEVYTGQSKEGSIDELIKIINNYKLFDSTGTEYNAFNFFDTNMKQNTSFFLEVSKEFLSENDYVRMIELINQTTPPTQELKDLTKRVFDHLYSDESAKIWDDALKNGNSKYILKTESLSSGVEAEELFKDWIKRLSSSGQNFELVWSTTNGSPIDRILGIDAIIKIDGVPYAVQIKKFTGTINVEKKTSTLGEYYSLFSVTRKEFNENVEYGCAVDSNGRIIMMGKQAQVTREGGDLVVDKTNIKIRVLQARKMVFIDDPKEGIRTYVNFDAIDLKDLVR